MLQSVDEPTLLSYHHYCLWGGLASCVIYGPSAKYAVFAVCERIGTELVRRFVLDPAKKVV
jgi:hypothetical protein